MGIPELDEAQAFADARRPLRDLMLLLPHLQVRADQQIDYESATPELLAQVRANAETTMRTMHRGTVAIGRLLVQTSPEIGTGEFSADCMESLGYLLAELGDLAATSHSLASACWRYTVDYAPDAPKHVTPARP